MNKKTQTLKNVSYRIELFVGCPIYGILTFDKKKGYLKYHDEKGEIKVDLDNYNTIIIESIQSQAKGICKMEYAELWSF